MSNLTATCPAPLQKHVLPFLQRADELDGAKHTFPAYFVRTYAAQLVLQNRNPADADQKRFLLELLGYLETFKKEHSDLATLDGRTVVTRLALTLFAKADELERQGQCTPQICKMFFTASVLFETTKQFNDGKMDTVAAEKHKYARFIAGRMTKCIKDGTQYQSLNQIETPDAAAAAAAAAEAGDSAGGAAVAGAASPATSEAAGSPTTVVTPQQLLPALSPLQPPPPQQQNQPTASFQAPPNYPPPPQQQQQQQFTPPPPPQQPAVQQPPPPPPPQQQLVFVPAPPPPAQQQQQQFQPQAQPTAFASPTTMPTPQQFQPPAPQQQYQQVQQPSPQMPPPPPPLQPQQLQQPPPPNWNAAGGYQQQQPPPPSSSPAVMSPAQQLNQEDDLDRVMNSQKWAKQAIAALQFADVNTAKTMLQRALTALG